MASILCLVLEELCARKIDQVIRLSDCTIVKKLFRNKKSICRSFYFLILEYFYSLIHILFIVRQHQLFGIDHGFPFTSTTVRATIERRKYNMAPKEEPSSHRSAASCGMNTDDEDTESGIVDKPNVNSDSQRAGLVEVIRKWLFDYHGSLRTEGEDGNMEGGNSSSSSSRYRLTATIILTFASVYLYRNRRAFKSKLNRMWPTLFYLFQQQDYQKATTVSLSFLRSVAEQGLVERALVTSSGIIFLEKNRQGGNRGLWRRSLLPPNSANLQSDLLEALAKGGCSDVSVLPESLLSRLATPLLTALPFVYLAIMYRILKNMHGGEDIMQSIKETRGRCGQTTFRDVAGLGHVQQEVAEIVSYLADPGTYRKIGATPPKGILLHGPPGAGKTLCAKAVAGEARCDTFIACSGSDFCEMFVGRGAARVRALFGRARSSAKEHRRRRLRQQKGWFPTASWLMSERGDRHLASAIIFIDELDALAKSRSYGGLTSNDERDQTLNQLLTEMDGFPSQDEDVTVMVIAATNRPGM